MKFKGVLAVVLLVGLFVTVAGCDMPWDDKDDGGGGTPPSPTGIDIAGNWLLTLEVTQSSCSDAPVGMTRPIQFTFSQSGSSIWTTDDTELSGTINTSTGNFELSNSVATLIGNSDGSTMNGTAYTYDDSEGCGVNYTFTGYRQ